MDEHRVAGAARNAGGRVEEGFGRVTGDTKSQVQGVIDQAQGTAEIYTGRPRTLRAVRPKACERRRPRLKTSFAVRSRIDRTRPLPSHLAGLAFRQNASAALADAPKRGLMPAPLTKKSLRIAATLPQATQMK